MNDLQVKDRQWWENYFAVDGGWERNGGRDQSRLFAEAFTQRLKLERGTSFSLLDVGCALGEAIKHFSQEFPKASLYGIDFTRTAIERCRQELGNIAVFEVRDMLELERNYDLIYISNVLEHFADFADRARKLMRHCRRLCVLVPYLELKNYETPLVPDPKEHHQHTFDDQSFDFLVKEGLASEIHRYVFSCYPAWGWSSRTRLEQSVKNVLRGVVGKRKVTEPLQVFYDIQA